MSTRDDAGHTLTLRILQLTSRKRMFQREVAQRAGFCESTFYDRVRFGNWNEPELLCIADALDVSLDDVLNVTSVL
jgi:hypothetical protein